MTNYKSITELRIEGKIIHNYYVNKNVCLHYTLFIKSADYFCLISFIIALEQIEEEVINILNFSGKCLFEISKDPTVGKK